MTPTFSLPRARRNALIAVTALAAAIFTALSWLPAPVAQVTGDRGIAAVVSSTDIDVGGIEVDESGDSAREAREKGWETAQRKAWEKLGGPATSDSQIQSMVSSIVIEKERIGPRRYIATLGVIFDRSRAGGLLGSSGRGKRSAPMLVMPVTISGGASMVYERRNPWQRVWAEYQAGGSRVDYVRPSGAGADSLLLNYGQISRRSRTWWRNLLDQFGAADVLIPVARLEYQFPGGPVKGTFTGRYGPDNTYLGSFSMTAPNPARVPDMMTLAVKRFDAMFEQALTDGQLRPDPTLNLGPASIDPALDRLLQLGRAAQAREREEAAAARRAQREARSATTEPTPTPTPSATPTQAAAKSFVVQFATPDVAAFDGSLAAVRAAPGVSGAGVSSAAIGGTSVMNVTYAGDLSSLAAALRGRGFTVREGAGALAISR